MIVVEVQGLVRVDLDLVEALARLQVAARRVGGIVVVRDAPAEFQALIEFAGLDDVLSIYDCPGRSSNRSGKPNSGNKDGSTK